MKLECKEKNRCVIFYNTEALNLIRRHSSVVEHFLGKEEVVGSSPIVGSEKSSKKFGETKRITNFVKQKRSLT